MKKLITLILMVVLVLTIGVGCTSEASNEAETSFKYYTAEETKNAIENGDDMILLDIQVEEEWEAHHIDGAIPTHAYPVKTDEEKAKLDTVMNELKGDAPIVIICPGGAGGAQRTYEYLLTKEIDEDRLFILENGQSEWPYEALLAN